MQFRRKARDVSLFASKMYYRISPQYFHPLFIYHSVQDVEVAEEEADSSEAGRQLLLRESQQPQLQPVRLLNNRLLPPCRRSPQLHNKAGGCSLESGLPLPREWHSERGLQLPTVQLAPLPIHLVEVMKQLQLSSSNNSHSSMPLLLSNNNSLGHVQMIRSCSLTA